MTVLSALKFAFHVQRRLLFWLILVAAAIVAVRLATFHYFPEQQAFLKYLQLADRVAAGELPRSRLNDVSPLYLWLVALARVVGVGTGVLRTLQIAATGVVAVVCGVVARRFGGTLAAVAATIAILGSRAVFLNATEFEPETLILLLHALAFFFLLDLDPSRRRVFAGAVFLGASIAARPTALLAAIVLLVFLPRRRLAPYVAGLALPIGAVLLVTFLLTGHATVMNPGTVFYEGMNPRAEGYEGIRPAIVSDVGALSAGEPDTLHIAFRRVASRALGKAIDPAEANRYWVGKALAYVRAQPADALALVARKAFFAVHSYDAWDIPTMILRTAAMSNAWIPFGVLVALAPFALLLRGQRRVVIALLFIALSYVAIMAAFYVTGRQRNAMIPAMAILAGVGVAGLVQRRSVVGAGLVVVTAVALTHDYAWQRENSYNWLAHGMSNRYDAAAQGAERAGDMNALLLARAHDATWLFGPDEIDRSAVPPPLLSRVARERLAQTDLDPQRFDLALALLVAGDAAGADQVLGDLQQRGYVPMRRFSAVRSVAYYRMLAALRRRDTNAAREQLQRATAEAPAQEEVLAFRSLVFNDAKAREHLFAVHDPFTARFALAYAKAWLGRRAEALQDFRELIGVIPEWSRPKVYAERLIELL